MKILYIIARGDAFGGASLHVRDVSRRLMDDGHEVRILVGGTPDQAVPQRFAERALDFVCIRSMGRSINPWKDTLALLALRREVRQFGPDIVSTHASKGGALGRVACIGLGIPTIYTPHCWSFVEGFRMAHVYRWMEKILALFTSRIVAVCDWERRFGLARGVGRDADTITIHNGVIDLPEPPDAKIHEDGSPVNLVMTGRFEDQKDQALLISALASLTHLDWRLTFVGDGPNENRCRRLADELAVAERIEFAGYSSHVETTLASADIFLLITNWEGFPRSILEAMRAGLPAIVSDVGGSSESVIDGETGYVVPKGDFEALVDALAGLIADRDLRSSMGQQARANYCESFTFETMFAQYQRLYRKLAPEKHSSPLNASTQQPATTEPRS
ncbi:MAG: glycosyltransferase involved in cell wall biosynthesis [Pseudoalteromonas tetraodonis]|jgi:glycosyltransferase involved in cell wall biosynthesis